MREESQGQYGSKRRGRGWRLVVVLGLALLLVRCTPDGNGDRLDEPAATAPELGTLAERQAAQMLLDLYQQALRQEDIDRLQELLVIGGAPAPSAMTQSPETLRALMTAAFGRLSVTDLQLLDTEIRLTPEAVIATFLEVQSVLDPVRREQRTAASRTTFEIVRQQSRAVMELRIAAVRHAGPRFHVVMPGQTTAGALTRVLVSETTGTCTLTAVDVEVPETGEKRALVALETFFHGLVTAPPPSPLHTLRVTIRGRGHDGAACGETVPHRYHTRPPGSAVVQQLVAAGNTPFFTGLAAPDGTLWFGGDAGLPGTIGTLVQLNPDGTMRRFEQPANGALPLSARARIEDLTRDRSGRLHVLFVAQTETGGIVGNGVVVMDPAQPEHFCQTVNVLEPNYPFSVVDPRTGDIRPSPSTRVAAAAERDVWVFGSDGGVALVRDTFDGGRCLQGAVTTYQPVFRRQGSPLLANTVPALVAATDGAVWFGTALGVTRLQAGQFTPLRFDPGLALRGNAATLEMFFQEVTQALFAARPLTTVALGSVSFAEAFGTALIKADLNFSATEDQQGGVWFGTLGGGLRRFAGTTQTLHLTRLQGLSGNLVLALAVAPDGALWAVTENGLSRVQVRGDTAAITSFTTLEGLPRSLVRDVVAGADGTIWLATEGGLFRLLPQGGTLQGVVHDAAGTPVAGADVHVLDTPAQAVTDAAGRFVLDGVPPGQQVLQVRGDLAVNGPFASAQREVAVTVGTVTVVEALALPRQDTTGVRLVRQSGNAQVGVVGLPLALPLIVAVQDALTNPIEGIPVRFRIIEGRGTPVQTIVRSDGQGQAAARLTATAAGPLTVEATADAMESVVFTAMVREAGRVVQLRVVSGNNQVTSVGQELPAPLVVRLEDQLGTPIGGETVTAEVIQGEGVLRSQPGEAGSTDTVAETDSRGEARFFLRAGPRPGEIVTRVALFDQEVEFVTVVGFTSPQGVAVEGTNTLVLVDLGLEAVIRVDTTSGSRTLVSGRGRGQGTPLGFPQDITAAPAGVLFLVDGFLQAVVRVESASGDRAVVSGRDVVSASVRGDGPLLTQPVSLVLETPESLLVLDRRPAIIRVHLETGDRTTVSADAVGSGVPLVAPIGLALEPEGSLVVTDIGLMAVVRVDTSTGARRVVSDGTTGTGPAFEDIGTIDVEASGALVVTDNVLGIVRVDPRTGNRTPVSSPTRGTGPPLIDPVSIAAGASDALGGHLAVTDNVLGVVLVEAQTGNRRVVLAPPVLTAAPFLPADIVVAPDAALLVVDIAQQGVLRLDPATGVRTPVADTATGSGPPLGLPVGLTIDRDGALLVASGATSSVVQVAPATGNRTVVTGPARGAGPMLQGHRGLAVEASGTLVVTDGTARSVVRVNRLTGDRTVLSGGPLGVGAGAPFAFPQAIVTQDDGTLLVVDAFAAVIVAVEPFSGDRTDVSGPGRGRGVPLQFPQDAALETHNTLVVVDDFLDAVVRVDLRTGDRDVVSGGPLNIGHGPALARLTSIAVEPGGDLVVGDLLRQMVLRINPRTGDRTIVSR